MVVRLLESEAPARGFPAPGRAITNLDGPGATNDREPVPSVLEIAALAAYPPSRGRRLWLIIVPCPRCSSGRHAVIHVHRAGTPHGVTRRAPCGEVYSVLVRPGMWAA